jgi:hypothetical protein
VVTINEVTTEACPLPSVVVNVVVAVEAITKVSTGHGRIKGTIAKGE